MSETSTKSIKERTLESTPTWAVATVCFVLILVSVFLEHLIHLLARVSICLRVALSLFKWVLIGRSHASVFRFVSVLAEQEEEMRRWESWEAETRTLEYQSSNDPRRFKLVHQTSFARRHLTCWSDHGILRWPACFLRQFYNSVSKVDYLTLRHGFITAHLSEGSTFDFQKYIKRALEKDFGVVVGISFWIWIFLVIFIFFHAHAFYNYLWLPFIPLVMLLLVGTKLQGIITKMCFDSNDKSNVARGTLLVKPSDHFFWFGKPKLLLHLMHFILFQNSFQVAFFTWTWYKFGFRSCFHERTEDIVIEFTLGALVQFLCGYVTLPLYALVTQMGTSMGGAVFTENVREGLKRWRATARKNLAHRDPYTTRQ
ncbi:hypothetical protein BT93_E2075 [Corymbia citriodora subsp. variegata]|nr:hypothetical protein BT93_E2075 [Corymbia citriodora subsp. variegata]